MTALILACHAQADNKLFLFTEQFPPYNMTLDGRPFAHDAEEIGGLCTDMVKEIIQKVPYEVKIKLRNWSFGLDRVKRKPNHGIYCAARTEEREAWFEWVGPLTNIGWTLFSQPESNITLNSLADAKKYEIGGYKGDVMTNYLLEQGFNVSVINNDALNPRRLQLGQIDLWVSDELAGPYTASDAVNMDPRKVLTFKNTPLYLALNKDTDPKMVAALQKAAQELIADGTFAAIENLYGR
ncbi:amino acid ABC transporter substrate-binding protein [Bacterioplanes sanyensis]|uniref:Amino acid ABC transporter substrate-binding protein n=2 Tax=Bacterioplanes sanyensis TaxID=1249553 RepID=A0A222FPV5_9GAMM|nr:amino acid ABC transporter substrate-binding protein [Bacterioplanes sanyensis]